MDANPPADLTHSEQGGDDDKQSSDHHVLVSSSNKKSRPNWVNIPSDILVYTVNQFLKFEDLLAMRAVSPKWLHALSFKDIRLVQDQKPWLYLKEEDGGCFKFFSIERRCFYRLNFPESAVGSRVIGTQGWLIFIPAEGKIRLVHPFTKDSYVLPSPVTLKKRMMWEMPRVYDGYVWMAVLSPSRMEIMIIHGLKHELAVWRAGDEQFRALDSIEESFVHVAEHENKFFCLESGYSVFVLQFHTLLYKFKLRGIQRWHSRTTLPCAYLVIFSGDLIFVQRNRMSFTLRATGVDATSDVDVRKYTGDVSIFVGQSSSIAVKGSTCEICFTDDGRVFTGWSQRGVYHCSTREMADEEDDWVEQVVEVVGDGDFTNAQWLMPRVNY